MPYEVEWPNAEYHEILPNLFLGGCIWEENGAGRDGRHSSVSDDPSWDYVISFFLDLTSKKSFPQCDMRLVLFEDTEGGLDDETWKKIRFAVDEVVFRWRQSQKVLVRCQAGYNRSGLVMSLVLMRLGMTADEAIHHLRWLRGRSVLVNPVFERYVYEREAEYLDPGAGVDMEVMMGALEP